MEAAGGTLLPTRTAPKSLWRSTSATWELKYLGSGHCGDPGRARAGELRSRSTLNRAAAHGDGHANIGLSYYNTAIAQSVWMCVASSPSHGRRYVMQAGRGSSCHDVPHCYELALQNYTKARDAWKGALNEGHVNVGHCHRGMGQVYEALADQASAKEHFTIAFRIYKAHYGDNHPRTIKAKIGAEYGTETIPRLHGHLGTTGEYYKSFQLEREAARKGMSNAEIAVVKTTVISP